MTVKGISAQELNEKILNKEQVFILDVRNETDFNDWKVEGSSFST